MDDCLFGKIASGKVQAHKVYEDKDVVAFLDINPVARGHVLVMPRQHIGEFYELGGELYSHLWSVIQQLARDMKHKLGAERVNIKTVGEHVPDHAHIHLIPVYPDVAGHPNTDDAELAKIATELTS